MLDWKRDVRQYYTHVRYFTWLLFLLTDSSRGSDPALARTVGADGLTPGDSPKTRARSAVRLVETKKESQSLLEAAMSAATSIVPAASSAAPVVAVSTKLNLTRYKNPFTTKKQKQNNKYKNNETMHFQIIYPKHNISIYSQSTNYQTPFFFLSFSRILLLQTF